MRTRLELMARLAFAPTETAWRYGKHSMLAKMRSAIEALIDTIGIGQDLERYYLRGILTEHDREARSRTEA